MDTLIPCFILTTCSLPLQVRPSPHPPRRENRRRYLRTNEEPGCREAGALDVSPKELHKLQDIDESYGRRRLIVAPSAAAGETSFAKMGYSNLLYSPPGTDGDAHNIEELVLPTQLQPAILKLAHDTPMAGHHGKKTADCIRNRFYWPGMYRNLQEHCGTCGHCQNSSAHRVKNAPLVTLLIMDEPFRRIAMDIVGLLPCGSSGKRYIIVICDYATRYPEAVALRTLDANAVAEELLAFFARVGVAEEILTDQGTNFTSQLLREVYGLL